MMNRIVFIDNLKAFAILLVILGHGIQYLGFEWGGAYNSLIFNLIYSFHLPLFMALSGFFFAGSLKLTFKDMLWHKTLYILLPSIIWCIPNLLYTLDFYDNVFGNHLWFLKSVWSCYLIFYLFLSCLDKKVAYTILLLMSFFLPLNRVLPGWLNWMIPCFMCGIILHDFKDLIVRNKVILLLSFFIWILIFVITTMTTNFAQPAWFSLSFFNMLVQRIMNISGIVFFFCLFSWLNKSTSVIMSIGKNTLAIYAMNILFCDIISRINLPESLSAYKLCIIISTSFVQIVAYYYIVQLLEKNKYTSKYLLAHKPIAA